MRKLGYRFFSSVFYSSCVNKILLYSAPTHLFADVILEWSPSKKIERIVHLPWLLVALDWSEKLSHLLQTRFAKTLGALL